MSVKFKDAFNGTQEPKEQAETEAEKDIYTSLNNSALEKARYDRAIKEVAQHQQEAIKKTESIRIEILQSLAAEQEHDYKKLFLLAAEGLATATDDKSYFEQIKSQLE